MERNSIPGRGDNLGKGEKPHRVPRELQVPLYYWSARSRMASSEVKTPAGTTSDEGLPITYRSLNFIQGLGSGGLA